MFYDPVRDIFKPITSPTKICARFQCSFCHKKFVRRNNLHQHLKTHTDQEEKFRCKQCGKELGRPSELVRHSKVYTWDSDLANVATSVQIHDGGQSHVCPMCSKTFVREDTRLRYNCRYYEDDSTFLDGNTSSAKANVFQCTSGNCTFPKTYWTLGMCSECEIPLPLCSWTPT